MSEVGPEAKLSEREEYWKRKLGEHLAEYQHLAEDSKRFEKFVGKKEPTERGDELMSRRLSAGYNFATFKQFPINSKESLIFYGVYFQRIDHFGELLARMEVEEGIIKEENVSFGVRATKVSGDWDDPECEPGKIETDIGTKETRESVEGIVVFRLDPNLPSADRMKQAVKIVDFLTSVAPKMLGGYDTPDIRTTATDELKRVFINDQEERGLLRLRLAVANVYKYDSGNLIALKQKAKFEDLEEFRKLEQKWKSLGSLVNKDLYEFLTSAGVKP